MKLYLADGTKIIATKQPRDFARPRGLTRRQCFGRTWDSIGGTIDGVGHDFYFDSTWGKNFWVRFKDGMMYTIPIRGVASTSRVRRVAPLFTKNPMEASE